MMSEWMQKTLIEEQHLKIQTLLAIPLVPS